MRSTPTQSIALKLAIVLAAALLALVGASGARADVLLSPFPEDAIVSAAAAQVGWYHDPVSAADKRIEVPVPSEPAAVGGPLEHTVATYRAANGRIAVPVSWAFGHRLLAPDALVFNGSGLFGFNSPTPTASARADVARLTTALEGVDAVRCEGYTDFGGLVAHEQRLSQERAGAICGLIDARDHSIDTESVGYAGTRPVIVGGSQADRAANRRVIVEVTASLPAPRRPGSLAVIVGDSSVTLTFLVSAHHRGAPVSSYEYSLDGGAHWRKLATHGSGRVSATIVGLTNGRAYTILVRARDVAGSSEASSAISFTPVASSAPTSTGSGAVEGLSVSSGSSGGGTSGSGESVATVPGAPTLSSVTPEAGAVTLHFNAPASNGGSAVTGYEYSSDGGTSWQSATTSGSGPYTAHVSGLTNGTEYQFAVRAVNAVGDSASSNVLPATPLGVAEAPTLFSVTPESGAVTLRFGEPMGDGGSVITGYEYSSDGGSTWQTAATSGSGPYTASVSGLTNGAEYQFAVRAVNAVGDSASSNVLPATPATVPGAATLSNVTPGEGAVTLYFSAPASDGGSVITGYQYSSNGGSTWQAAATSGSGPYTATVSGLSNGDEYQFTVRAVNAVGDSARSNVLSATPVGVPEAPTLSRVWPESGAVTLRFSPAMSNGGSVITGYQYSSDGGSTWQTATVSGDYPKTAQVTGLTNGTEYRFAVRTVNSVGDSASSNVLSGTPLGVPAAPTLSSVTPESGAVTLHFAAPASDGGSEVTGYEYSSDGGTSWQSATTSGSGPYSAKVTGLTNGTEYQFAVRALNTVGDSARSNVLAATPSTATVPSKPEILSASVSSNGLNWVVSLSFTTPASNGAPITGYVLSTLGPGNYQPLSYTSGSPNTASFELGESCYTEVDLYLFLEAVNTVGASAPSRGYNLYEEEEDC